VPPLIGGVTALADLVLPSVCAGCERPGAGRLCPGCASGLAALRPVPVAPTPAPAGLPPCTALGRYDGPLRGLILAYKERGAHRLARPLGSHLARAAALCAGHPGIPLVIVPVPSTAAAVRARHGDHMVRIAHACVGTLRSTGHPAVLARGLAARPKADAAHLSVAERAAAAAGAFRARPGVVPRLAEARRAGARLVVIDDVLTTGATADACTKILLRAGALRVDVLVLARVVEPG